jgi:hypothetical protein
METKEELITNIKEWVITKFTDATDAFSKWWADFSLIDIILTPFNWIKEKAISLFDDLIKSAKDILSFDLVGKISDSISSLVNSVWGFFKSLPGKALNLIGGFIPDSLKNLWSSVFGSSTPSAEQNNTTPAMTAQNNVASAPSGRDQVFNQQSARMATSQASSQVVIINNNNNLMSSAPQNPTPRTSGAVSTAPQDSHIDRALYGNSYGAGVA